MEGQVVQPTFSEKTAAVQSDRQVGDLFARSSARWAARKKTGDKLSGVLRRRAAKPGPLAKAASGQNGHLAASAPLPTSDQDKSKSPSKKQRKSAEYMAKQRAFQAAAREKLLPMLRAVFPQAFPLPPVPLAIGIHKEILAVAGDEIDPKDLGAFLKYWCSRRSYLLSIWRGMGRRNLDGSIAGVPTIKERNDAGRGVWRDRYRPIEEPVVSIERL